MAMKIAIIITVIKTGAKLLSSYIMRLAYLLKVTSGISNGFLNSQSISITLKESLYWFESFAVFRSGVNSIISTVKFNMYGFEGNFSGVTSYPRYKIYQNKMLQSHFPDLYRYDSGGI